MITRKTFLCRSAATVAGCCAAGSVFSIEGRQAQSPSQPPAADREKQFIQNWLSDRMRLA